MAALGETSSDRRRIYAPASASKTTDSKAVPSPSQIGRVSLSRHRRLDRLLLLLKSPNLPLLM